MNKYLPFLHRHKRPFSFKGFLPIVLFLAGVAIISGMVINQLYLSKQSDQVEEVVFGTYSEHNISPTPSPTSTFVSIIPTSKPSITPLKKNTPTPTPIVVITPTTNQSQNSTTNHSQTTSENIVSSPEEDPYIDYLDEQIEEIQKKREFCEQLYAEVTASIQPLLNSSNSIMQEYSEAIAKNDADKIGYYQQEFSDIQAEIKAAYDQNYYSICP